jgi:hypothetical protein
MKRATPKIIAGESDPDLASTKCSVRLTKWLQSRHHETSRDARRRSRLRNKATLTVYRRHCFSATLAIVQDRTQ